jgi:hypothetical protein
LAIAERLRLAAQDVRDGDKEGVTIGRRQGRSRGENGGHLRVAERKRLRRGHRGDPPTCARSCPRYVARGFYSFSVFELAPAGAPSGAIFLRDWVAAGPRTSLPQGPPRRKAGSPAFGRW